MGIKRIYEFIKRLIRWMPVLWGQVEYDIHCVYDLMEFKMKEIRTALEHDTLHVGNDRYIRQINICLAHLDRYRHWEKYIDFDTNLEFEPTDDGFYRLKPNKTRERAIDKAIAFEEENYQMFWKRFIQWHNQWWC